MFDPRKGVKTLPALDQKHIHNPYGFRGRPKTRLLQLVDPGKRVDRAALLKAMTDIINQRFRHLVLHCVGIGLNKSKSGRFCSTWAT